MTIIIDYFQSLIIFQFYISAITILIAGYMKEVVNINFNST